MSKISVLVPTYKPEGYIVNCLKSLENQTLSKKEFKVYIALNGSDKSYENYVKNLLRKTNFDSELFFLEQSGVSNARNFLIKNSIEPFITFIDDDDVISENYLENLLLKADENYISIANVYNFEIDVNEKKNNYIGDSFLELKDIALSFLNKL